MSRLLLLLIFLALAGCGLVQDRAGPRQKNTPSPGDERLTESWRCVVGEDRLWHCEERQQAEEPPPEAWQTEPEADALPIMQESLQEPTMQVEPEPESSEPPDATDGEDFVLQLGAFEDRDNAVTFAESLQQTESEILRTSGRSGDRYLVLTGNYPDAISAREAAEELLDANPGLDFWIRAREDL